MEDDKVSTLGGVAEGAATGAAAGPIGAVAGAGLGLIGGMMGQQAAAAERRRQDAAMRAALAEYAGISVPDYGEISLQAPELQYLPDYMETAQTLGPSAYESINISPEYQQAQLQSLSQLQQMGEEGLTAQEQMALRDIQEASTRQAQAQQNAILEDMARRGMGGSGTELAARLQAGQAGAQRTAQQGRELASLMEQARRGAIAQAGGLAGNVRRQEFGEQGQIAGAKDVISRFNLQNTQNVAQRNIEQQRALQNLKQRYSDVGKETANQQEQLRRMYAGQKFGQQMDLAGAKAGIRTGQAGQYGKRASEAAQAGATGGAGAAQVVTGVLDYLNK